MNTWWQKNSFSPLLHKWCEFSLLATFLHWWWCRELQSFLCSKPHKDKSIRFASSSQDYPWAVWPKSSTPYTVITIFFFLKLRLGKGKPDSRPWNYILNHYYIIRYYKQACSPWQPMVLRSTLRYHSWAESCLGKIRESFRWDMFSVPEEQMFFHDTKS